MGNENGSSFVDGLWKMEKKPETAEYRKGRELP